MIMVFDWHSQDSRASGPLEVAHTVTQQYGTGGGNTPIVAHDGLLCRATGQAGAETLTDCAPCLNCDHEAPIVAGCLNPEDNQSRRIYGEGGQAPTLSARESAGAEQTGVLSRSACGPPYIIRCLAPLECGRLQGFPDGWAETAPMDTDDPKEILFWMGVYVTDCKIKGKRVNAEIIKHPAKLARWHDGLHSAAAEYKMWGNGMALPNALFFLQRLQAVMGWCTIRLGSLFDGSGTMPLAAEMCGMRAVWASEVEPYPIAVTRTHLPYMEHLGSVTDIDGGTIPPVDVITFGSPCQDLSIAGRRAGLEGKRSGLFAEAVRIIREMRQATGGLYPRFAIWENVPGSLSSNGGKDFETVINTMLQIARPDEFIRCPGRRWPNAANYGAVAYRIVDAQYWGVPQRRRRIYLVADFDGESAGDVVFERKGAPWYFDPRIPAGQTIAALAPDCYQWRTRMVSERGTVAFDGDAGATVDMTVYTERSPTLKASQKESVAIGLMAGQSASAGSTAAELEVAPTLRSSASGTNQAPTVVSLMGNVIDRQTGQNGAGIRDDGKSYTLDTISRHGVAYKKER